MTTIFSTRWNQGEDTPEWKKIFSTEKSPRPVWPYSKAVEVGELLFCSGQVALDPQSMEIVSGGIEPQTHQVCKNISGVLEEYGRQLQDVVKTTIFLTDINDFNTVNEIYGSYFSHKPARSCVEISKLPKGALIEIEVIAKK